MQGAFLHVYRGLSVAGTSLCQTSDLFYPSILLFNGPDAPLKHPSNWGLEIKHKVLEPCYIANCKITVFHLIWLMLEYMRGEVEASWLQEICITYKSNVKGQSHRRFSIPKRTLNHFPQSKKSYYTLSEGKPNHLHP